MTKFHMFETAIGVCGIVWRDERVVGFSLPEATEAATRARLLRRFPDATEDAPTSTVQRAIDGTIALIRGEKIDLNFVDCDLSATPEFNRRVYEILCTVPAGETVTYGDIAHRLGDPGAARAVGRALGENPIPVIVPCHRVLAASGKSGGFSAPGGADTKLKLLSIEGARTNDVPSLFDTPLPLARKRT
ncbi:methylated-DNA--[protein]-cysteine S-methyltransferase [Roseiterribacter gracilis]|uniref:methylated-DNA--[protein]-cysteine S-methyltransferase n=1 Tax=Roseiterribacter gracilis TaxID=2812848 RepID=A0A8S8XC49_9PROT|nr:methylated-DNA--[protein]-cysteine S-methyltransferase [Rhodospirillales bacterium TMPK1]